MRFVTVGDLRGKSGEVWSELAAEREMVITNNGRPIAILAAVDEGSVEEALAGFRQARAAQALASLQQASVAAGRDRLTDADIQAEIDAVRSRPVR